LLIDRLYNKRVLLLAVLVAAGFIIGGFFGVILLALSLPAFLPLIIVAVITVAFASFGAKTVAFFRSEKQVASGQLRC